jgi:hemoglobin
MSDSLYTRLGGYDAIATFAATLVGRAQNDDLLARFWKDRAQDGLDSELQLLINYLVHKTGGQMYYAGREMAPSHKGMGITEADWGRFLEITGNVAVDLGVGSAEGGEVMAFLDTLKADILD